MKFEFTCSPKCGATSVSLDIPEQVSGETLATILPSAIRYLAYRSALGSVTSLDALLSCLSSSGSDIGEMAQSDLVEWAHSVAFADYVSRVRREGKLLVGPKLALVMEKHKLRVDVASFTNWLTRGAGVEDFPECFRAKREITRKSKQMSDF